MSPLMPLARELGERLGGDPWCRPIPKLEPVTTPVRMPDPKVWGELNDLEGTER